VKNKIKLAFIGKVPWPYEQRNREVTPYRWGMWVKKGGEKFRGK